MKNLPLIALLTILLLAGCTGQQAATPEPALQNAPGFRYLPPENWKEIPAGQGLCEANEHCWQGPDGAILAVLMTTLEEDCEGSGSLAACMDEILPGYPNQYSGYAFIDRQDYTTMYGQTGEEVEFTFQNGQIHGRELWTHEGGLRIRLRFLAPEAAYQALDEMIETTFLTLRPNPNE